VLARLEAGDERRNAGVKGSRAVGVPVDVVGWGWGNAEELELAWVA